LCISDNYWIALTTALILSLVLRTIKKQTNLLDEKGRT
jgi:hypothetical protein